MEKNDQLSYWNPITTDCTRSKINEICVSTLSAVRVLSPSWQVICRPWEYPIPWHQVLCRPWRCLHKLRKYSIGRDGISAVVASTLSPVRVIHPAASGTLSAVRVLFLFAEVFCRPLECFLCVVEPRDRKRVHCIHSFFGFNQDERSSCVWKICPLSFRQCKVTNILWDIRLNRLSKQTN